MTATPGTGDPDLLIDLLRRSPLLEALAEEPLDRREIQDRLNVSRATSHRHTRLLEDLGAVERSDGRFRLTESGTLLADALVRFKREARSALDLAPVLATVRTVPFEVDVEAFADARVTSAERGDPYSPVARFVELVQETGTLRGLDIALVAPLYVDEIQGRIVDGMETVDVERPEVVENVLEDYPEKCMEACASGHLTVGLHDELPFGLVLFDDRVGIGVPDRDSRTLRAFADTDSPAVREWAETVYDAYRSASTELEEVTWRGFEEAVEARS